MIFHVLRKFIVIQIQKSGKQ